MQQEQLTQIMHDFYFGKQNGMGCAENQRNGSKTQFWEVGNFLFIYMIRFLLELKLKKLMKEKD